MRCARAREREREMTRDGIRKECCMYTFLTTLAILECFCFLMMIDDDLL